MYDSSNANNVNQESSCTYQCAVTMDMLNGNGLMKPGGYQKLICDVAEMHLDRIHLGVEDLANYHVAWVLISSSFEIIEPIRSEITVVGRTWHSALDKLTFRRELTFTDQADRPLFHAVTFTVLMDTTTRRIVRPDKAGFDIGQPLPEFTMDAVPKLRFHADMQPFDNRRIYPSQIDRLGHVNNGRYSEFAYDALTAEELERLGSLRRMDLNFLSELRLGNTFTLRRALSDSAQGELLIDGVNDQTGRQSFTCRMLFS